MEKVFIGVIEHKYGINHYASKTEEGLKKQLAEFCTDWWDDFASLSEIKIPATDQEIIDVYFDSEHAGAWESMSYEETNLI